MRITDLEPGERYVVVRPFKDDRGTTVLAGDRQTFERIAVAPVTAAFTVVFREETLVLHEDRQPAVVEHAERFFQPG